MGSSAGQEGFDRATALLSAAQSALIPKLLSRLISLRSIRWKTLRRYAKGGLDLVDVEETVLALERALWVEVSRKADKAGDRVPRSVRLLEGAVEAASDILDQVSPSAHAMRLAKLIEGMRGISTPVPERVLVRRLFGQTKLLRVREYRAELESALGRPLEEMVRFHVDTVLTAGPVRFRFRGVPVDLRGSEPWAAITQPVAAELTDVEVAAGELICVENQTVFESLLYEGLADQAVVMFTAGYLGAVERLWLESLLRAGVRKVRHWGDLDPWGLDIYRDLREFVLGVDSSTDVQPWRMGPEPLGRADTQRLNSEDWRKLHRYLALDGVPLRDTALEMKRLGVKLEQEALLA